ncbi:MAG: tryptophan 7-halogenase [Solirubrobacterales bacterium]
MGDAEIGEYDVVVAGGGPAGAAAAITLARAGLSALLIEGSRYEDQRLGETLPPAAAPLLARLGLSEGLADLRPIASHGNASAWGDAELERDSFLFHAYGDGWHLDRRRFDEMASSTARDAGATVITGQLLTGCTHGAAGPWRLKLANGGIVSANALIDATGRSAKLVRRLGARRRVLDHLVAVAVSFRGGSTSSGHTLIEAQHDGWWYSAPLPGERLIVMFMTDADICRANGLHQARRWAQKLATTRHTRGRVGHEHPLGAPTVSAAVSHRLQRDDRTKRWTAAGDAALSVDPLSASGIVQALSGGELAARAIAHGLLGRDQALVDYESWLDAQFANYLRERQARYSLVTRWPNAPFWNRRRSLPACFR